MFCSVTTVLVDVLYYDSGTCKYFELGHLYVYVYCIVTAAHDLAFYCDSGTCTCFVF